MKKSAHRGLSIAAGALALTMVAGGSAYAAFNTDWGKNLVGQTYNGSLQVSDNQQLKPLGDRLVTEYGKFMGSTVSPDGRFLAATSTDRSISLQVFDLQQNKLVWRVGSAKDANQVFKDTSVGQENPTFSPDGKFLWIGQTGGVTRFPVNADGSLGAPTAIKIPAQGDKQPLPAGITFSADGSTMYVAVNGQNTVVAMDPASRAIKQTWNVGIAPREIKIVGGKLYVSNEGGRRAQDGDTTINSYGTDVPADPYLGTSTNGTLSVIDPTQGDSAITSIEVGLHPTALYAAGNALFVANTNSDSVSVVDVTKNKVVQTISTQPYSGSQVGYAPTAMTLTPDGHLLVTLSRANAVAVYSYSGNPQEPVSHIGLLPTDYYPSDIAQVNGRIVVTNTRGIDARGPEVTIDKGYGTNKATGHGTHSTTASLTTFTLPNDNETRKQTKSVFDQNDWGKTDVQQAQGNKQKADPVPKRIGDPSTIKHVFLIVKENRTYDQVYGDMGKGNGEPTYAQFGKQVTPNGQALANRYGLFDNVYDIGTNSAEGHNWLMQGDDPEYTERSAGEYKRSYDTEDDVLGHQRSGFLWTSVESAHNSARNYGEFMAHTTKPKGADWQKYYCTTKNVVLGGDPAQLTDPSIKMDAQSPIPSLNEIAMHEFPQFDTNVPDVYRAQLWKQDFEKNGPKNFQMLWLSSDHTGGAPDARAQVADSDLATGQIIDEISHSQYWKDSVIFVVEDDSQNGVDHVDGHRSPILVVSPYAKKGVVNSTYYSQLNVVRTIQQILGAQPLNQKLAAASPMYDAFTDKPDFTPYDVQPNLIPLTENLKTMPSCGADVPGTLTPNAGKVTPAPALPPIPANMKHIAALWEEWRQNEPFVTENEEDEADPALMGRFTWYQAHNFTVPYPGDTKIYAPNEVPGAQLTKHDDDDEKENGKATAPGQQKKDGDNGKATAPGQQKKTRVGRGEGGKRGKAADGDDDD